MEKINCKELRILLNHEWERFTFYSIKEVESFIKHNFITTNYAIKTLSREFAGRR